MKVTLEWPELIDKLIIESILSGNTVGLEGAPDRHIETGLAHVFFYGDSVFKLYKTHNDKDHFIKGVLAPTKRRQTYIEHDFTMNRHFGQGVYKKLHGISIFDGVVSVSDFVGGEIHALFEMNRLDFDNNLHERLLRKDITEEDLYLLGFETARLTDESEVTVPEHLNWYIQATERMRFLEQFVAWLPEDVKTEFDGEACFAAMRNHLETHKENYAKITASFLKPDLDNHDENVFFSGDTIQVIDVVPPMDCWWFGVPISNLTSLVVNVETLFSEEAAQNIVQGFKDYYKIDTLPENLYEFTRAFSYLISIAHFGSVEDKKEIALKYAARCADIPSRL